MCVDVRLAGPVLGARCGPANTVTNSEAFWRADAHIEGASSVTVVERDLDLYDTSRHRKPSRLVDLVVDIQTIPVPLVRQGSGGSSLPIAPYNAPVPPAVRTTYDRSVALS